MHWARGYVQHYCIDKPQQINALWGNHANRSVQELENMPNIDFHDAQPPSLHDVLQQCAELDHAVTASSNTHVAALLHQLKSDPLDVPMRALEDMDCPLGLRALAMASKHVDRSQVRPWPHTSI
jgi:hypothetical protein